MGKNFHSSEETLPEHGTPRPDLTDKPILDPDWELFTDGSLLV